MLITGATGTLGQAFVRFCEIRGIPYYLLSRQEMNITDSIAVERTLTELQPWAVINAAGYVRVGDAEHEPHLCHRINAEGATILAKAWGREGMVELPTISALEKSRVRSRCN